MSLKNYCAALMFGASLLLSNTSSALSPRQCNPVVPKSIKYRPEYPDCGNKAAVILSKRFRNAFSVAIKKVDHNDRLANNCPDASCSPFKTQRTLFKNGVRIACFGASGNSPVFNGTDPDFGYSASYVAKWISIKLKNSGKIEDVEIYCLPKPYPRTSLN